MAGRDPVNKLIREALDEHFHGTPEREEAARLVSKVLRSKPINRNVRVGLWLQLKRGSIVKLRDWVDGVTQRKPVIPPRFRQLKSDVQKVLNPIQPRQESTQAPNDFLFTARKAKLKSQLPAADLIYLLFVELLGYENLGRFEKIAWSVPLDFHGRAFLVEHRKFGWGIFVQDEDGDNQTAEEIAVKINRACRKATPFFEWHAQTHLDGLRLNVHNKSRHLHERYKYFLNLYFRSVKRLPVPRYEERSGSKQSLQSLIREFEKPKRHKERVEWLALAVIDAFFSWTEHVLIHIAIMGGRIRTGEELVRMVNAEWAEKFKKAIDIRESMAKMYYDTLIVIRRQLRNFVAHGAFGKRGEAFQFHSPIGAIPVTLSWEHKKLELTGESEFDDQKALVTIAAFVSFLWSGERALMKLYIQGTELPLRPSSAKFGEYAEALKSKRTMKAYIEELQRSEEDARHMDW